MKNAHGFGVRFAAVALVVAATTPAAANAPAGNYTIAAGVVHDVKTKLDWQQSVPATSYSWAAAKAYCAGMNATLGGKGWRLPTIKELQTLVDRSQAAEPTIDQAAFPNTPPNFFWSSTPLAGSPSFIWCVNFSYGGAGNLEDSDVHNVRCVR
ncbi:MAG: DUF1566 domain-containing protein [Haliangium ochraceum]